VVAAMLVPSGAVRANKAGNVHESANRRVFYDFTLSPPKSVSIAALVGYDQRVIEAHDESVQVAIRELQLCAATRVLKQNHYAPQVTSTRIML
jgi:conjugative relaxase-like TrwC/TraI family protein